MDSVFILLSLNFFKNYSISLNQERITIVAAIPDHYLDITSDICPITFVKAKLLLEKMAEGEVAEIKLGEGEPLENVPRSVVEGGDEVISLEADPVGGGIHVLIVRKK